jgi:predicted Rossmann fold nucleotide-binding protein DprA/Smf involved in DNA uptake
MGERLGNETPPALYALGPLSLLAASKTALFCSTRASGDAILRAHDAARRFRDEGITVISGFHSAIEKECLRILLRGRQPIIICPARAIDGMRVAGDLRPAFEVGRLLFLSPFETLPRRVTRDSAVRRNEVVAALADEAFVAHVTPGGQTERLAEMLRGWGVPMIAG